MQVFVLYVLYVSIAANELFWTHNIFDVMEVRVLFFNFVDQRLKSYIDRREQTKRNITTHHSDKGLEIVN